MHWIRVKYSLFFLPDGKRFCRLHFQSVWLSGFCPAAAVLLHPLFCSPGAAGTDAGRSQGLSQEEGGSTAASPAAKQHTVTALPREGKGPHGKCQPGRGGSSFLLLQLQGPDSDTQLLPRPWSIQRLFLLCDLVHLLVISTK